MKRYVVIKLVEDEVCGVKYPKDVEILGTFKTKKEAQAVKDKDVFAPIVIKQIEV